MRIARNPLTLLVVGVLCTLYGLYLMKRPWEGDTLCPGTTFTYLPKWLFYLAGLILQIPLPAAFMFLKSLGHV